MRHFDCIVVGLGPAGSTALRDIGLAGMRVLGLDAHVFPRYKPCGGALSALAQQQLQFAGWQSAIEDRLYTVQLALRYGPTLTHTTTDPICCFVMRDRFDHLLLSAAAATGAEVIQGAELQSVEITPIGVTIHTSQGPFSTRCLLGADGAKSAVARCTNLALHEHGAALEAEISVPDHIATQHNGRVYLSYGEPKWGYAWVFPKANRLSVGVGSFSPRSGHLRHELQRLLDHCGLHGYPMQTAGHLIPLGGRHRAVQRGPVLLAGDAAGFTDPLSGEGIAYALLSGHIAAKHVVDYVAGKANDFAGYQHETDQIIRRELTLARWIAGKLYAFPGTFFWLLQQSPATLALYFKLVSGEATYQQVVNHLKRKFLLYGVMRKNQTEDLPGNL